MELYNLYQLYKKSKGISTDTRSLKNNQIFFSLKGENFDGNQYALQSLQKGACYAVVDDKTLAGRKGVILVPDALQTLQELAKIHHAESSFKVIAITGSNGKTTTKELLFNILKQEYKCDATQGNLNNHIGVPLTLLSFSSDLDFGIVEMGANHIGEIDFLCQIAQPEQGVITNIGKAHLEGFGSIEGVAQAKSELFYYLGKNEGTIFFNNRLKDYINIRDYKKATLIPYSLSTDNFSYQLLKEEQYIELKLELSGKELIVNSNLTGIYNAENILTASTISFFNGVTLHSIKKGIYDYIPRNNRSQRIKTVVNEIISDCYNANPTSMKASIDNLITIKVKKKACIIGEMNELGAYSTEEHQHLINYINKTDIDVVYYVGRSFQDLDLSGNRYFANVEELINHIKLYPLKDYMILLKGSRTNKLENIIDYL